jgi:metal-sulfur cluster biosynthetic enzyme
MLTEDHIREALRACYATAPGHTQPVNIVDLGMVVTIAIAPDADAPGANIPGVPTKHRIAITLLAISQAEDAQGILSAQIANCLAGFEAVSGTKVVFGDKPEWTPALISRAGRQLLQLDFPILNNRVR